MRRLVPLALLVALGGATATSCSVRRPVAAPGPGEWGVYRARLDGERSARFRVLLWAERPDRIHLEVLPPVGGPEMVVDGGDGRLAVILPGRRLAYAGEADPLVMGRLLGSRHGLSSWVGFLLGSERSPPEITIEGERGRLPRSLRVRAEGATIALELRRVVRLGRERSGIGTGVPPEGLETRPLGEIGSEAMPWDVQGTKGDD